MNMNFSLFLLAFTMLWKMSNAIQCYKCEPEKVYTESKVPICQHFDYSERFIADCPQSTGCIKKETLLISLGMTTKTIERGCAHQTMSGEQEKINGHWQHVSKIHEVYEVACTTDSSEFDKPTRATNCFCRGDLCNSAESLSRSALATVLGVLLWLALK